MSAVLVASPPLSANAGIAPIGDTAPLAIPGGPITATVDPSLRDARGQVTVSLRLADAPLAEAVGASAKQRGSKLSRDQQRRYTADLQAKQADLMRSVAALGGIERAALQKALNAVVVTIDAAQLEQVAALPQVTAIRPVLDAQMDLSETVPLIGAAALHARTPGITGAGIKVAVLDSGVDYTHARLGGAGTIEAYQAAYGTSLFDPRNTTTDGLFPTAKVAGGFDFVGEAWPTGPVAPDPDPIDCGPAAIPAPCAGGHGTHVASIIAGNNGVAPGATLYAVKVCSSVSTACNGAALLQGMDFALDPNGDGDISDAVDVVNLSVGSFYGQIEDDLAGASTNAVNFGVVVVAAAGNNGNLPYIASSPASAPGVISVAQTQVPSALVYALRVISPDAIAGLYKNTNTVSWAPITTGFTGALKYGATTAERLGCDAYPAGFFDGLVALIDRGICTVSIKVDNAADAGAVGVVIVNNVAGAAPSFSFGGPATFTPAQTIIVGQEVGGVIKPQLAPGPVTVAVSLADATSLAESMVSTSARGPNYSDNGIKPDIGAPGASVSADAGSGTGESAFSGTSGATPMVAGSAALTLQAHPGCTPSEVKSVLMNTAETAITIDPSTQPGVLAEITRIGGGEVRVDRAVDSTTAAWDSVTGAGSLSYGYVAATKDQSVSRTLVVRNYAASARTYTITPSFRYANDAASGAAIVSAPSTVTVPGHGTTTVKVSLKIAARKLNDWILDGGPNGGNGSLLATNEVDGYLTLSGGGDQVHVAWQVLAHRAADVQPATTSVRLSGGSGSLTLSNGSASGQQGTTEVFALTGTSGRLPTKALPGPGDNFAVIDLKAVGVRQAGTALQVGVTTFGERAHPGFPAQFRALIDTNRDGTTDFIVFNGDIGFLVTGTPDGRNAVFVQRFGSNIAQAFFFTDADLDSANAILTVPLSTIGLTPSTLFDFTMLAVDNYFTGVVTDAIGPMTFTAGTPRFAATAATVTTPAGGSAVLGITAVVGGATASPAQTGLLLLQRDAVPGEEIDQILVS
jgi:subtilisin family serine protease